MGMSMFPDTVTLYNKYMEDNTEKWKRTELEGVYWNDIEGTVLRKTGAASSSNATVIIPLSIRGYQKPKEWRKYRSGWTLQPGDYICRGQINIPISRSAAKELSGFDDVRSIVSVDCKRFGSGMDHLEVAAK